MGGVGWWGWMVDGPCDFSEILIFSFFGGLLFKLGVCLDRGLNLDFDQI